MLLYKHSPYRPLQQQGCPGLSPTQFYSPLELHQACLSSRRVLLSAGWHGHNLDLVLWLWKTRQYTLSQEPLCHGSSNVKLHFHRKRKLRYTSETQHKNSVLRVVYILQIQNTMCEGYSLTFRAVTDSTVFFILADKIMNKVIMQNYE